MNDVLVTLSDNATQTVQDLVRLNIDSAEGFTAAAEMVDDSTLAEQFREYAAQREGNAEELKATVAYNGETPASSGTPSGTMHRWWLELRGKVTGGSMHSILSEAERGEDTIKHRYEAAMKELAGTPVAAMLAEQYHVVKLAHDRIRDLRDATR